MYKKISLQGERGLANDTLEFREHEQLIVLFEVHRDVRQISNLAGSWRVANDTAELGAHD